MSEGSPDGERGYHHGDLRAALIVGAIDLLESGEPFSLRAVARRAGVSATAPYRHFGDREALESAVAVEGFKDLRGVLGGVPGEAGSYDRVVELAVAYVRFALGRPAIFRLMFGRECDDRDDERVRAAAELNAYLDQVVAAALPDADVRPLGRALWSLAHGLAFLHLDGKFDPRPLEQVDARVRESFAAIAPMAAQRRH